MLISTRRSCIKNFNFLLKKQKMFTEISELEAEEFCNVLEKEWLHSMNFINYIKTSLEWRKKKKEFEVSLLYNKENEKSGVFIGIMKSGCIKPTITVYAFDNHDDSLKESLMQCLDWNGNILFKEILVKHLSVVREIAEEKNCELRDIVTLERMYMPIEDALKFEVECPNNLEFRQLSSHHLEEIYNQWIMTEIFTIEHLRDSLRLNKESAIGIFEKNSDVPLSRCLRSSNGDIMALQTIEKVRGKGYAKLLIKKVTKSLAQLSIQPFAHAADFNTASLAVFYSIGYKNCGTAVSFNVRQKSFENF